MFTLQNFNLTHNNTTLLEGIWDRGLGIGQIIAPSIIFVTCHNVLASICHLHHTPQTVKTIGLHRSHPAKRSPSPIETTMKNSNFSLAPNFPKPIPILTFCLIFMLKVDKKVGDKSPSKGALHSKVTLSRLFTFPKRPRKGKKSSPFFKGFLHFAYSNPKVPFQRGDKKRS